MTPVPPRLPDWRPRLSRYLTGVAARHFAYGTHDCALFAAGAVEAMTGVDPAAGYRGRYTTLEEGLDLLRPDLPAGADPDGEIDHIAVLRQLFRRVPVALAQVGDLAVVTVAGSNLPSLGVVEGQHIAVLKEASLGFVPREAAVSAWTVP